ncbi:MAG: PQQ-dependent sugar dehydrogenase [Candidatus Methanoperedens sp.]|uniref:PQQ-dependent sugar dehydrogenase n=1 Tax=Candidatus Methanoperedens nitratireducens TaxID=1392998 RepID=UPI0009DCC0CD|nr:PQQ-dependent sugar dehydrogenase [Candidatus Methanoperedens nitroreducens]MDJ1422609.1 PQQ-dependent sugar dehydrogenase [Candidatus Methanoperedens sp.]
MSNRRIKLVLVVLFVIAIIASMYTLLGLRPALKFDSIDEINLPQGFSIEIFAENLGGSPISYPGPNPGPRMMLLKDNVLFVTIPNQGRVVALPDRNGDNRADEVITFIDRLNNPHGIDFYNGWFYIAEESSVIRVKDSDNDLIADMDTLETLIDDLPSGGHFTRTVKIHNNSLYLSMGSSCNVCYEEDERRAAITRCALDGTGCRVFARGLRNAVGFVFHPVTGKMYATDNGRDWLGDDLPPDEINLVEDGKDYGWPICFGKNIHDTDFDKNVYIQNPCMEPLKMPSLIDIQAHSAPLGLAFYYGDSFPQEYRGDLFVALHGSWNRREPTGYKIISIDMNDLTARDFATGWLQDSNVLGRPVDIIVAEDGSLFVSDDNAGKIYRISYPDIDGPVGI